MAKFSKSNLNLFLALKLPSAFFSGIRVVSISDHKATARVKHRWINQNPFKSLYWATQGMAAELVTGLLMMKKIKDTNLNISMLVVHQSGNFTKKATGKIIFSCNEGAQIDEAILLAAQSGEGQTLILTAAGTDEENELVSNFEFTWSIKLKQ